MIRAKHYHNKRGCDLRSRSHYNRKKVRQPNEAEALFDEEAKYMGWELADKGWPDRLVYCPATGKTFMVEIKFSDYLSPAQYRTHQMLQRLGIKILVVKIDPHKKNATMILRRRLCEIERVMMKRRRRIETTTTPVSDKPPSNRARTSSSISVRPGSRETMAAEWKLKA